MRTTSPSVVDRRETVTRFIRVGDELGEIRTAWRELEDAVGSLKGRHCLAAFDPRQGWYQACVEVRENITDAESELPQMVIPGGQFLRLRLRGEPPDVYDEIAPAYELLAASATRDDRRPSLEIYRRFDEIDVLMPTLQDDVAAAPTARSTTTADSPPRCLSGSTATTTTS